MEFEKSLARLEEIKFQLEVPELSLDDAINLYQESVSHVKECIEALKETEGKICVIKTELDKIIEQPLEIKED